MPPFKISDSLINEARIVYIVRGHSRLNSANEFTPLKSGDLLIMKTDNFINNWLANESGESSQVIVFQLNTGFLNYLYDNNIPDFFAQDGDSLSPSVEKVKPSPVIQSFYDNLQTYLDSPSYLSEEVIKVKTKELISIIIQSDNTGSAKKLFGNLFTAKDYSFQEVIQKNLFEDLNLEDLAFFTGLSLSSFKRKFSTVYGTSPNKYFISKRLEKAQQLLKNLELNIAEIAYECGFNDVGYFSRTFRKYYNLSPSAFRKSMLDQLS
jgi:AraC-like DNA-binding protein